jgi:hypothetical protein
MIKLSPQILEKNGKKEFVIISYEEFVKIQEELDNYDDLCYLREAKKKECDAPTLNLKEVKEKLNI